MLVARATSRAFADVARDPYQVTLYTAVLLEDEERRERALREFDMLNGAQLTALAFHEPPKLQREQETVQRRYGTDYLLGEGEPDIADLLQAESPAPEHIAAALAKRARTARVERFRMTDAGVLQ